MLIIEKIAALVFFIFLSAVYIFEIWHIAIFALCKLRGGQKKKLFSNKKMIVVHLLAVIGIICFLYGYFIEPYRIEVTKYQIRTAKLSHESFRIVHISDLHCDKKPLSEKSMVEIVNNLEPDIIVFTGDAVNRPSALPLFKETMNSLKASLGKVAVYGNWETSHWPGLDFYSGTDVKLLEADILQFSKNGESITVAGLNCDKHIMVADGLWKKLSGDDFNVFVFHFSDLVEYMDEYDVDLYLCGHTHGGQIALPFYGALVTMSKFGKMYEAGMYSIGDMILYVNRGIGMDAFPAPRVRFLARPEVAVFDIIPEN